MVRASPIPPSAQQRLNDREWLLARYVDDGLSVIAMANMIGVTERAMRRALREHWIPMRTRSLPARLDDPQWLRRRYAAATSIEIAAELRCSQQSVQRALARHGIPRRVGGDEFGVTRIPRPDDSDLRNAWDELGTILGVGTRFGVADATAGAWLAGIGIFTRPPAVDRDDLVAAIERCRGLPEIAARLGVSTYTVRLERLRFGV